MAPLILITTISLTTFNETLSRYPTTAPAKLAELDTLRYVTVPEKLTEREKEGGGEVFLEKEEVEQLVEWKLKHGTFRPKLLQLVQSNDADLVREVTRSAFKTLDPAEPIPALKAVTALKGVGPATASLLLAVFDPEAVPFFSDELFRWVTWEEGGGGGGGWDRKIKYNVKEYGVLVEGVRGLRERLGVRSVDIERVAWVLGKERLDVGVGGGEGLKGDERTKEKGENMEILSEAWKESKIVKAKRPIKVSKKSVKRKTEDVIAPEVRRSSRRKTEA